MHFTPFGTSRTWNLNESFEIRWEHVQGEDQKAFSIYLTNRRDNPSVTELVLHHVVMGCNKVEIPALGRMENIPKNNNYKLWACAYMNPHEIYAESDNLKIEVRESSGCN